LFRVEAIGEVVERGDKCRAGKLRILEEITDVEPIIREFSSVFGEKYIEDMVREQLLWREALSRPFRDESKVEKGLKKSLEIRGLDWKLRRFDLPVEVSAAWSAWDARYASADWYARSANAAWNAWDAWNARSASAASASSAAWSARSAWDARSAWCAGSAWDGLTVYYASKRGWVNYESGLLTTGLREAYKNGLGVAIPIGEKELGWAMEAE
jgi:hypothetical protein